MDHVKHSALVRFALNPFGPSQDFLPGGRNGQTDNAVNSLRLSIAHLPHSQWRLATESMAVCI